MIQGLQIIGILFGLCMLYLTFLYYKKNAYDGKSFALWSGLWIFFLVFSEHGGRNVGGGDFESGVSQYFGDATGTAA